VKRTTQVVMSIRFDIKLAHANSSEIAQFSLVLVVQMDGQRYVCASTTVEHPPWFTTAVQTFALASVSS
jgi:hypothetical protein